MDRKQLEDRLRLSLKLSHAVRDAAEAAETFRSQCNQVKLLSVSISRALFRAVPVVASSGTAYLRPFHRILSSLDASLSRSLPLLRRCRSRRRPLLRLLVSFSAPSAFPRSLSLLSASLAELSWLIDVYSDGRAREEPNSIDTVLARVWTNVAAIEMGVGDPAESATALAEVALLGPRNKDLVVEEGGVPPLLGLLVTVESASTAAATALYNLSDDADRVSVIAMHGGVQIIAKKMFESSSMRTQSVLASLVSRMAGGVPGLAEEFGREGLTELLIHFLSMDLELEMDSNRSPSLQWEFPEMMGEENPKTEVKLKIDCAEALCVLIRHSDSNCRQVANPQALLCLAKIIETEKAEEDEKLKVNCLSILALIAVASEDNHELRRVTFKMSSFATKAIVEQLLHVIEAFISSPESMILAIRSLGSLARIFPTKESLRVVKPLVHRLGDRAPGVAVEAVVALCKFTSPENFNCVEHSKAIIDSEGVVPLMRLLRPGEPAQVPALTLLCYLAINVSGSETLERVRTLNTLQVAYRSSATVRSPQLKELIMKAILKMRGNSRELMYSSQVSNFDPSFDFRMYSVI
ncbi:hypothetical protein QJS10_CPA06g01179 [Acorus calamus]|uniref:DUF7792 domain-containing protein n=1 Tax=Acorus calamus TaxID=4465 RepID=A0AAV9EMH5_ACOCL|nr:hypothetical protein QJS10_CPA06g01179 [Acorus calamus]